MTYNTSMKQTCLLTTCISILLTVMLAVCLTIEGKPLNYITALLISILAVYGLKTWKVKGTYALSICTTLGAMALVQLGASHLLTPIILTLSAVTTLFLGGLIDAKDNPVELKK